MVDFWKLPNANRPEPAPPPKLPPTADPTETHYADEYEWEEEEREDERQQEAKDADPLGCCFPDKCVMPGEHHRSECYTAEMAEEYERGQRG